MVNISEAIQSGAWLRTVSPPWDQDEQQLGETISFQLRVRGFEHVDIATVDSPEKIDVALGQAEHLWIVMLDLVNLCTLPMNVYTVFRRIRLVDGERNEFIPSDDYWLTRGSEFSERASLQALQRYNGKPLPPKVRRVGALLFELPDFFEGICIGTCGGPLQEA